MYKSFWKRIISIRDNLVVRLMIIGEMLSKVKKNEAWERPGLYPQTLFLRILPRHEKISWNERLIS